MTVADLIQMAGGFKEGATPQHIEISRRVYNSNVFSTSATMAQIFDVNVNADLSLENPHFMLRPFDVVEVRPAPGYAEQKQVTIKGEVLYPGIYTLSKKNERVSDLVARAGGLTAFAYADGTSLRRENRDENKDLENQKTQSFLRLQALAEKGVDTTRASQEVLAQVRRNNFVGIRLDKILAAPHSKYDLILKEGDVLTVPVRLQTVKVNGEVLYPVTAVFRKRKPLRYYISQAGGFSNSAKKGRVYVVYANGFVKSTNHILFFKNYPHLEPGAEIFVPAKPERRRLTPQEIFGIGSGATALTAAIITILNLIK
jgi:protein involved in polysaccharide export with SLBB domain